MRMTIPISCVVALGLAAPAAAQDARAGAVLYADFCAVCHGRDLRGDGPLAGALAVRPPDLTTLAGDGEFPVLEVARQIDGRSGILAHGGEMPLFGRYFEGRGPHVALQGPAGQPVLLSQPVADLIAYLMEEQS
ncbi:cytochrome c [Roseibacterium sp. SDUM158017]|uniref:c-type cytochrome n=1 Tax=Roseicyclus salinarum TaxID=3036773 RepID=UPI002415700F|nr:cytochrome c [Roseibacterium sp. SDUM158017]MDG4647596.1 cytochrome c [Roseibacterium sp. SDUM158017]